MRFSMHLRAANRREPRQSQPATRSLPCAHSAKTTKNSTSAGRKPTTSRSNAWKRKPIAAPSTEPISPSSIKASAAAKFANTPTPCSSFVSRHDARRFIVSASSTRPSRTNRSPSSSNNSEIKLPHRWEPRAYQVKAWRALAGGVKRAALVWHRRAGKDLLLLNFTITQAVQRVGVYWHVFPTAKQGRKIL